ncbi:CHAD domain-containing protein [Candidatus Palauibacter sp.]|uniref:CYTH and CHAD domain-containing protein n=1 Tax=Candidatus Palauibacter sp. TaxID=3101350 RepID=UPI003AF268DE
MPGAIEVEVKLTGSPAALSVAFADLGESRLDRRKLLSTYYDTTAGHLRRRGFALRVRDRNGRQELTLKQDCGDGLSRGEWNSRLEAPLDEGCPPDLELLPRQAPRAALGLTDPGALEPTFFTEIERRTKEIGIGDAVVEASLDTGRIVAGDRHEPVAELEFELLSGPVTDMLAGVRRIVRDRRLAIGTRSKAARGTDLLLGTFPSAVRAARPNLDPSDTIDRALARVGRVTSVQVMGNLAPIMEKSDAEGVHQLRVALRRLRSALLFFKHHLGSRAAALDREARRALKRLGAARDLDVFLLETLPPVIEANPDGASLIRLREAAENRRAAAYEDVCRLIGGPRFNCLVLDLLSVAESGGLVVEGRDASLAPTATRGLARRHRTLMRSARDFGRLTEAQRHRVRIDLKKLRYACDYSRTLFPGPATSDYLKRLSGLQDDLGHMNDAAVARKVSREVATDDREAAAGASLVNDWQARWARSAEPRLRAAWQAFAETRPCWPKSEHEAGTQRTAVPPHSAPEEEQRQK